MTRNDLLWWLVFCGLAVGLALLLVVCKVDDYGEGEEDDTLTLHMDFGAERVSNAVPGTQWRFMVATLDGARDDPLGDSGSADTDLSEGSYLGSQPLAGQGKGITLVAGRTTSDLPIYPLPESRELPWRGLVAYDLNEPAFDAGDLATKAARTFLGCEVLGWIKSMGNMPKDAVGAVGERGGPQIHPTWRQKMADMGLDIEVERDRWTFAIWLVENSGWSNWFFCQHTTEGADGTSGDY